MITGMQRAFELRVEIKGGYIDGMAFSIKASC